MSDELVDILDEQGNVLYPTLKTNAHKLGLLHKTVISQVINKQGQWLLVKQASNRQDPGQFVSPIGGHVKAGESCDQALVREGAEEVGIEVKKFQFIGEFIYNRTVIGRKENHMFVVYEVYCDQTIILNEESTEYVWLSPLEMQEQFHLNPNYFGASFHALIDHLYSHLKTI